MQLDLENAGAQWIKDAPTEAEKLERGESHVLEFRTEVGQADFHALRHTYLSRLGRSGVSAKAMQKLARHSTVELTIGRYTHTNINDLGSAVQQMIRKRPGNPFLPGSVVLSPVNSGLWAFSGEVSYERTGAGLA